MKTLKEYVVTEKVDFARPRATPVQQGATARPSTRVGRIPRVARLMALAIHYQRLMDEGAVKCQSEIAMMCHVTRARVTQVMNLLLLAPDIQEAILFLPPTVAGRDPIKEWHLRPIAAEVAWERQRQKWTELNQMWTNGA